MSPLSSKAVKKGIRSSLRQERRQAPRISEKITLAIQENGGPIQGQTKNLSATGAYCTLNRFIAPMTKVQLEFELPAAKGKRPIRCEGVVVRAEPVVTNAERGSYHIAIFFTKLTEHSRSIISRFIGERLPAHRQSLL